MVERVYRVDRDYNLHRVDTFYKSYRVYIICGSALRFTHGSAFRFTCGSMLRFTWSFKVGGVKLSLVYH